MEKNRKTTIAVVAALIIAVVSLGIAFAAFSSTLTINGTATISASSWDIHFSDASNGSTTGGTVTPSLSNSLASATATSTSTKATLTGSDFTWGATFKSPGDKVQYHFYVTNQGDYNAVLSSINEPQVTCTKGESTAETAYCHYISYTVSYDAGGEQPVKANDTLDAKQTLDIYVTASLGDYSATLTPPTETITVNPTTVTLVYTQNGSAQ